MNFIRVNSYTQMLNNMYTDRLHRKHAIVKFYKNNCVPCTSLSKKLEERSHIDVDVYEVYHPDNKHISRMFGVRVLPTAVFFKDGMPIRRLDGMKEADNFLYFVEETVAETS